MLLGRRPLQSVLRFSKFQNFLCTKLGTTEFVKFGPLPVYWQPTPTGNINFFQLKLGKNLPSVGFEPTRTTVHLELNSWRLRPLGQLDEQICTQCDLGVFLFSATSFLSKHQH